MSSSHTFTALWIEINFGRNYCHSLSNPMILHWRRNGRGSVSNHQPHDCLLNRLFRRRSKKTSKLRVTGLCTGNSPGTREFPKQMVSNAENVSIWWRHHGVGHMTVPTPDNMPDSTVGHSLVTSYGTLSILVSSSSNGVLPEETQGLS